MGQNEKKKRSNKEIVAFQQYLFIPFPDFPQVFNIQFRLNVLFSIVSNEWNLQKSSPFYFS